MFWSGAHIRSHGRGFSRTPFGMFWKTEAELRALVVIDLTFDWLRQRKMAYRQELHFDDSLEFGIAQRYLMTHSHRLQLILVESQNKPSEPTQRN